MIKINYIFICIAQKSKLFKIANKFVFLVPDIFTVKNIREVSSCARYYYVHTNLDIYYIYPYSNDFGLNSI